MGIVLRSVVEGSRGEAKPASNGRVQAEEKDLLERGFRLAYFLFPDRLRAIQILCGALEKQQVQSFRENRRFYWRDKHPAHSVRRVTRPHSDLLQWLIMAEAERYEREEEEIAYPSQARMIIRYVKHLVEITSTMSSFYVNVGVNRVLHRYTTAEAQAAYEKVTSRIVGGDEYRRVKRMVMCRILDRFGNLLRTSRVSHGELRFELCEDQKSCSGLVRECLQKFTPWSTGRTCHAASSISALPGTDRNDAEIDHCHSFIEPFCHERLMKSIGSASPEDKLALPNLLLANDDDNQSDINIVRDPVPLSAEERNSIGERLRERKRRRGEITPKRIQILLDGVECAWLDAEDQTTFELLIEEGANLIEIRAQDAAGDILLGSHLIEYDESGFASAKAGIILADGNMGLEVRPAAREGVLPRYATVRFRIHVHSVTRFKPPIAEWLDFMLTTRRKFAIPLAMFVMGILVATVMDRTLPVRKPRTEQRVAGGVEQGLTKLDASHAAWYRLIPDEDFTRSGRTARFPTVPIEEHSDLVRFEIPIQARYDRFSDYAVELWAVDGNDRILAYDSLRPQQTPQGDALKVPVPAVVLTPGAYYTLKLRSQRQRRTEWLSNFSFRAILGSEDPKTKTR